MDSVDSTGAGSYSARRKRSHQQSIKRRLEEMDVQREKQRRKRGRKRRAREHFAEERDL